MQSFDTPTRRQQLQGAVVDAVNPLLPAAPAAAAAAGRSRSTSCSSPRRTGRTASTPRCCGRAGSTAGSSSTPRTRPAAASSSTTSSTARRTTPVLDDDERRDALAGDHPGLHPGDDRAPARRGARQRRPARGPGDVLGGRRARPARHRGRSRPAGRLHRARAAAHRHARGRPRRPSPGWSPRTAGWRSSPSSSAAGALGLLAHGDPEDVYTRSRSELRGLIQIAFGGQAAEEIFFGDVSTGTGRRPALRHRASPRRWSAQAGMADTPGLLRRRPGSGLADGGPGRPRARRTATGRRMVEQLLHEQKEVASAPCSRPPAPRRGPAGRPDRAARAHRARDHRRPRGRAGTTPGRRPGAGRRRRPAELDEPSRAVTGARRADRGGASEHRPGVDPAAPGAGHRDLPPRGRPLRHRGLRRHRRRRAASTTR